MYALFIQGKEAKSSEGNLIVGKEGGWYLVCKEPENWVPATGYVVKGFILIRKDAKLFKTIEDAEAFAGTWAGHPWWVIPNGNFKIIKVKPVYEQILLRYEKDKSP
jgi:hypothetical protein